MGDSTLSWKIPLFKILWDDEDVDAVTAAIQQGMAWAVGPSIEEFETQICEYLGTNHAVTFNSGTSALHSVLLACGIGEGDEVIVPSFTFIATANAPLFVGAKPVFAEIEENTYGLCPDDVRRRITPRTKAIIPVHYAGCPCFIEELRTIANEHSLYLIEDAAEGFGAEVGGHKVGCFGDAAVLSFCQNKVITTGEGGAVVTNSETLCEKLKLIRSQGRFETANYFSSTADMDYVTLGYNFRMSNITAALGQAQLRKISRIVEMRRGNAMHMSERLAEVDGVLTPKVLDGYHHVYQMYVIRLQRNGGTRDDLMEYLSRKGVMTRVYFPPVHLTQFYRREFGCQVGELPVTEQVASEVLTLPMHPKLAKEEMDFVVNQIEQFLS